MKKLLLYAFAAIVALASCTKDPASNGPRKVGVPVTYGFSVGTEDAMSRHDMLGGGMKNVDPEKFFIRYIIDLYNNDGATFAYRYERLVDFTEGSGTTFKLMVPTDKYKVAIWADFISREGREATPAGSTDMPLHQDDIQANDYWYDTSFEGKGLANVNIDPFKFNAKDAAYYEGGGRMSRDAYCAKTSLDLINNGSLAGNIQLKRILGRIAVYARNMDPDRLAAAGYAVPDSVTVTYPAGLYPSGYNVVKGEPISGYAWEELVYSQGLTPEDNPVEAEGKLGNVTFPDLQLITFDYLFQSAAGQKASFTIKYFANNVEIPGVETVVNDRTIVNNKQQRLVADVYNDDHQFLAVAKDADGKVVRAPQGELLDATTALAQVLPLIPAGGTMKLYPGNFKSTGLTIDKSMKIEGIEGKSVIYGETLASQITSEASTVGKNPILFIKGPAAAPRSQGGNTIDIKGITFTIKNSSAPAEVDGLTIDGNATVNIKKSVFDGIGNANPNYASNGYQYGRCITVMGGATLVADSCTFKKFNKSAVEVFGNSTATLSNSSVTGDNYNAQTVYNNTAGTPEEKLIAAYAGSAIQNGFVFRTGSTGSVTACTFTNLKFGLDKGLRKSKGDQSRAVYLYEPGTTTVVEGETDQTNIYTNCELNWSAWAYTPPSDEVNLNWIKVNGVAVADFDPATLTYNVNVASNIANATVTAETTDFYAQMVIDPAVATPLMVGVPVTFTISVTSESGNANKAYTVNVTRVPSTDATLSALKLNGATVTGFNAATHTYNVTVPNATTSATVTATANHAGANMVISPEIEQQLTVGVMVPFTVTVTAEDGATSIVYTVNVTRAASTDATLSDLQLNGATVTGFNASTHTYNIKVENSQTTAIVAATAKSAQANVVISPATEQSLTVNVMVPFTVTVTAEDGTTTQTYTVNVTRKGAANAKASGILVNGVSVKNFSADTYVYNEDVLNETATATVTATAEHAGASVVVTPAGSNALTPGTAKAFTVVVTAEDGTTTQSYTVNVTRALSANSKLSELKVNGQAITLVDGQTTYNYTVPNATETATVTGVAADAAAGATVQVSPSASTALTAGVAQPFTVTVTAANASTSTYTVNVTREAAPAI